MAPPPTQPGSRGLLATLVAAVLLVFAYAFPRGLLAVFGEESPWTSHWYLYGFGGVFFLLGLWTILHSGACKLGRGRDSFWFGVLIFGFLFYLLMHTLWILAAIHLPFKGDL